MDTGKHYSPWRKPPAAHIHVSMNFVGGVVAHAAQEAAHEPIPPRLPLHHPEGEDGAVPPGGGLEGEAGVPSGVARGRHLALKAHDAQRIPLTEVNGMAERVLPRRAFLWRFTRHVAVRFLSKQ